LLISPASILEPRQGKHILAVRSGQSYSNLGVTKLLVTGITDAFKSHGHNVRTEDCCIYGG
jgi:hypothetical protein